MISIDTNVLFAGLVDGAMLHRKAADFLASLNDSEDVAVSEFALVELYGLLRNPAVVEKPMSARAAADVCATFRQHPRWRILGFAPDSRALHDALWNAAGKEAFPRRRIYDLRMAMSLLQQGVTEFATVNTRDFEGTGFKRVFNPLA